MSASTVLPSLKGDTSLYAQAARDFCYQVGEARRHQTAQTGPCTVPSGCGHSAPLPICRPHALSAACCRAALISGRAHKSTRLCRPTPRLSLAQQPCAASSASAGVLLAQYAFHLGSSWMDGLFALF